jgi:hypothetical protein
MPGIRKRAIVAPQSFVFFLFMGVVMTACEAIDAADSSTPPLSPGESTSANVCSPTEPSWVKPPDDPAVSGSPEYGHYYVNQDRSIWASAWWTGEEEAHLRVSEEGIKVGWFRPTGAVLEITGNRLDGQSLPLDAHVPCCYPTRFQATGLIFPAEGCWEVTAKAEDSELSFVVRIYP